MPEITTDGIYEHGSVRLTENIDLSEGQKVHVVITETKECLSGVIREKNGKTIPSKSKQKTTEEARLKRGKALKAARRLRRWSAEDLAVHVTEKTHGKWKITKETIYDFERGRRMLHDDLANVIAQILDVPAWTLLLGVDPKSVIQSNEPSSRSNRCIAQGGSPADFAKRARQVKQRLFMNMALMPK